MAEPMDTYLDTFYDVLVATGRGAELRPKDEWLEFLRKGIEEKRADFWPLGAPSENVQVGGVMFVGVTVHIAVLPEWEGRWVTKRLRRAYDTWTHDKPILAPVKPDNAKAIALATRLGFTFAEDQGLYHLYVKPAKPAEQPAEEAAHAP